MYRRREDILAEMLASLVAAIPDAYVGEDGVAYIIFTVSSGQLENLYLANQLLLEDLFVTTASIGALQRHGDQYGLAMKAGTNSVGTLTFEGDGGTYVPVGAEVAYDPGNGLDVVYFEATTDDTIPDPGTPDAPDVAVNAAAGNLNGTYEYVVTFLTASGETLPSVESAAVNPLSEQVDLSNIPLGGTGTTGRRIYRDKNGAGTYHLVDEISDNVTTTWTDNIDDATAATGSLAPTVDTAHKITVDGQAQSAGIDGNVSIGAITVLTNAPAAITSVTNPTAFTGGTDPEDTEVFRQRLLSYIQSPGTGSPDDLKAWAEAVDGVGSATIFANDPSAGEVTVRISASDGSVPDTSVVDAVQAALDALDLANITITVTTFTAVTADVDVTVTLSGTYTLADVTTSVQTAIEDYINALEVGGTLYIAGIVDSVFGLTGIDDVVVTTPAANVTTAADSKQVPGTITVS